MTKTIQSLRNRFTTADAGQAAAIARSAWGMLEACTLECPLRIKVALTQIARDAEARAAKS